MAASTLVARSQRCHGVSAALAERLVTSNSPAGRIQASHRDPSDTYDLEMVASLRSRISAHVFELNDNALGSRRYPPFAQSSTPQYSKNYRLTQMGPSRIALLCECGKRTSGDRPVADRKALASTPSSPFGPAGPTAPTGPGGPARPVGQHLPSAPVGRQVLVDHHLLGILRPNDEEREGFGWRLIGLP